LISSVPELDLIKVGIIEHTSVETRDFSGVLSNFGWGKKSILAMLKLVCSEIKTNN